MILRDFLDGIVVFLVVRWPWWLSGFWGFCGFWLWWLLSSVAFVASGFCGVAVLAFVSMSDYFIFTSQRVF